jgi:hypothetical protein
MKILSFFFAILCATAALARPSIDQFNEAMRDGMHEEIKKDSDLYKQPSRAPASVKMMKPEVLIEEKKAIDKLEKQHKQLGKPSW